MFNWKYYKEVKLNQFTLKGFPVHFALMQNEPKNQGYE
jgi:hypothetical protein